MQGHTFTKSDRLLKPSEFVRVRKEGHRIHTRRFTLFVAPGESTHLRLGLAVSKRVGPAVVRNRVKRLLREFFRLNRDELTEALGGPADLLISAKSADGEPGLDDITRELMAAVRKSTR